MLLRSARGTTVLWTTLWRILSERKAESDTVLDKSKNMIVYPYHEQWPVQMCSLRLYSPLDCCLRVATAGHDRDALGCICHCLMLAFV